MNGHRIDNTYRQADIDNLEVNSLTSNGNTFVLPTSQGGPGDVMVNDGTGALSWGAATGYRIMQNNVSNVPSSVTVDTFDTITTRIANTVLATQTTNATRFYDSAGETTFEVTGVGASSETSVLNRWALQSAQTGYAVKFQIDPTVSADYTLTWPAAQATASGQVLRNNGTGVLSWYTLPTATPNLRYTAQLVTMNTELATNTLINVDTTLNDVTVTLPAAMSNMGQVYIINKIDATGHVVNVVPTSGERLLRIVDNTVTLFNEDERISVFSNGAKGWINI